MGQDAANGRRRGGPSGHRRNRQLTMRLGAIVGFLRFGCYNRCMPDPQAKKVEDRRDDTRADVDRRYTVRLDPCDGRGPIICAMLDFSVTGMRLEVPVDVALPA